MQSQIDDFVRKFRENKAHTFEPVFDHQNETWTECCVRCGKRKDHCTLPTAPYLTPCPGFIA